MSIRKEEFYVGGIYHVYNRGVDKRVIFEDGRDFFKFFQMIELFNQEKSSGSIKEYQYPKNLKDGGKASVLVEVVAFCFLPNHYHLILKQVAEDGISRFMQKLGTGYTMYFNKKNERSGSLFQGKFKARHVGTQAYLEYLSIYVNLNFKIHKIITSKKEKELYGGEKYRSSFSEYIGDVKNKRCNVGYVLDSFGRGKDVGIKYKEYADRQLQSMLDAKNSIDDLKTLS